MIVSGHRDLINCLVLQFSSGELSASGSSSASGLERESSPPAEGGDTEPVDEDIDENDDSTISESPPCSQAPSVVVSEAQGMSTWPLAVNQAIVKGVFGRILNRDDIVYILKKKFLYSKRT